MKEVFYCPQINQILLWDEKTTMLHRGSGMFYLKDRVDINMLIRFEVILSLGKL